MTRFERRRQPLASPRAFLRRMLGYLALSAGIVLFSLAIGILGYHVFEKLSWIDSLLNASMILGGMGPVDVLKTNGGKLFASFYALFSGLAFIIIVGVVFAPIAHRFLRRFHLEPGPEGDSRESHQ